VKTSGMGCHSSRYVTDTATKAGAAADKMVSIKETKYRQLANSHMFVPVAVETVGIWNHLSGTNTGAGPKNISRHSRHKKNRFPVSAAVRGFTAGKCGLFPQHFHHRINVAVVILLFFNIFCLRLCACRL